MLFRATGRCGGANASIRFDPEINHGANAGLSIAVGLLQPIKDRHPEVGWADLIQLASATAIEQCGETCAPVVLAPFWVATILPLHAWY